MENQNPMVGLASGVTQGITLAMAERERRWQKDYQLANMAMALASKDGLSDDAKTKYLNRGVGPLIKKWYPGMKWEDLSPDNFGEFSPIIDQYAAGMKQAGNIKNDQERAVYTKALQADMLSGMAKFWEKHGATKESQLAVEQILKTQDDDDWKKQLAMTIAMEQAETKKGNLDVRIDSQVSSSINQFESNARVKKAYQSMDSANDILKFVASGNPIGAAAIPTYSARMSGEVGALSEADKQPFGGSRAILVRLEQAFKQAANGKLTEQNAQFVNEFAGLVEKRAKEKLLDQARLTAKRKAGLFGLTEDQWMERLLPSIEKSSALPSGDNTSPAQSGPVRITSDADYNALPSGTQFVGPDGKMRRKP